MTDDGRQAVDEEIVRAEVARICGGARAAGRDRLLETEALAIAQRALGFAVPAHVVASGVEAAAAIDLAAFPGDRLVVKVLAAGVAHKSEAGGVAVVAKEPVAVGAAVAAMADRFAGQAVSGYGLFEYVPYDASPGGELLVGLSWSEEFGPVVTFGPGGIYAEHLAARLDDGRGAAVLSPARRSPVAVGRAIAGKALTPLVTGALRGQAPRIPSADLVALLRRLLDFAALYCPDPLAELEINPLVASGGRLVALDALGRLGGPGAAVPPPRPIEKIGRLLEPRSVAVVGVSRHRNPGRVIVDNLLAAGFRRERLFVVKPGGEPVAGCPTVPDLASLPEPVDLLVVSIAAELVPELLAEVAAGRRAESVILIPGGLGETAASAGRARALGDILVRSRATAWRGPVVNGANCLGVRSLPGRVDTLFIPRDKLPGASTESKGDLKMAPVALIAQSGAFAVARASKLAELDLRYLISIGNQLDLTAGDYLTYLKDDPAVELFAFYLEGFRRLDGRRWLAAAAEIAASGRTVLLYRAGRTPAGRRAAASHTAAVAGDYAVTRELAAAAGVVMVESLADFEDLVRLFAALSGRRPAGLRLGAVSNAGFECVAIADHAGPFTLPRLTAATAGRLGEILDRHRLRGVVEVTNPLDVTPILADEDFVAAAEAVLADPGVDAGVVGCVPLTGALTTLAAGPGHGEDLAAAGSVVRRLLSLAGECSKPWVAVVDAGPLYDPMARRLAAGGVPTFRSADRALRLFSLWCTARLEGERR